MNEKQYIEFCQFLDYPSDKVVPYNQLTDEQIKTAANSFAYQRFQIKQASDELVKTVTNSVLGRFPFLRP